MNAQTAFALRDSSGTILTAFIRDTEKALIAAILDSIPPAQTPKDEPELRNNLSAGGLSIVEVEIREPSKIITLH